MYFRGAMRSVKHSNLAPIHAMTVHPIVIRDAVCVAAALMPLQAIAGVNSKAIPEIEVSISLQSESEKAVLN